MTIGVKSLAYRTLLRIYFAPYGRTNDMIVEFRNLDDRIVEVVNDKCYAVLKEIKSVLEKERLSDFDCIEEIIRIFEDSNINLENGRHDFG